MQTWEIIEISRRTTERFHMYDMLWSRLLFYDGIIGVGPDKRRKWETELGFSSVFLLWITYTSWKSRKETSIGLNTYYVPSFRLNPGLHIESRFFTIWAQTVKNPSSMQDTQVWSLVQEDSLAQEDPLEKEMTTHSSILAWKTLWTEEPGGLQYLGLQRIGHNLATEQ